MLTPSSGLCLSMQRNCGVCWLGQSGIIIRLQLWQFIQLSLGCCFTGCKIHFSQAVRGRDTGWLPWSYCTEGCGFLKNTCSPARNARDDGLQVREFFFFFLKNPCESLLERAYHFSISPVMPSSFLILAIVAEFARVFQFHLLFLSIFLSSFPYTIYVIHLAFESLFTSPLAYMLSLPFFPMYTSHISYFFLIFALII